MNRYVKIGLIIFLIALIILACYYSFRGMRRSIIQGNVFEKLDSVSKELAVINSPKNMVDIPVMYINMEKSKDRRDYMESQSKKYNIPMTRVDAIDGSNINIRYSSIYTDLSPGEIGCTLSHIKAIRKAYDNNYDRVLILEDDTSFDLVPLWSKKLSTVIKEAPEDWEIIKLFNGLKPFGDVLYQSYTEDNYSTLAYIINRQGMTKILEFVEWDNMRLGKNGYPSKGQADVFIYALVITYSYGIPLFFPRNNEDNMDSTIHTTHTKGHITNSSNVVSKFLYLNEILINTDWKQLQFQEALWDMDDFLKENSIDYFLSEGTLLGIYREDRFIPHDQDIDLGTFDIQGIQSLPKEYIKNGEKVLELTRILGDKTGYELTYKHKNGVKIDIFPYKELDEKHFYTASYSGMCISSKIGACRWKKRKFGIGTIEFKGREFSVPNNIENFLEDQYGKNWNIPVSYNYYEGIEKCLYKGLVKSDFPGKSFSECKEEKKINNWYPRLLDNYKKPILWMYWEGNKKPPYIELCIDTIRKNSGSFEVIILNDNLVKQLSRTIHPSFTNISPLGMRADYIRFCMVYEYGGVWLDSDTIVQRSLDFIVRDLQTSNFVAFEHDEIADYSIGIFGGNKRNRVCAFMKKTFENEFGDWKDSPVKIGWATPTKELKKFVPELLSVYPNEIKTYYAPDTVYPIIWTKSEGFYWKKGDIPDIVWTMPAVCLHNSMYSDYYKKLSKEEVLKADYRISEIFRRALK